MKDEGLCVFLTESFHELQDSNYIEPTDEGVAVGNSVWYLLYFVNSQDEKQIVLISELIKLASA